MKNIITRLWGVCLCLAFQTARIVFTIARARIRGTMVAIWQGGEILLVKSSYRRGWSIPGGLVKRGETWTQTAVRETFEEVGIRLVEEELVFKAEVPGDLSPRDWSHLFEVALAHPGEVTVDGREIIDAQFVPPEAALRRRLNANVRRYLQARVSGAEFGQPPIHHP